MLGDHETQRLPRRELPLQHLMMQRGRLRLGIRRRSGTGPLELVRAPHAGLEHAPHRLFVGEVREQRDAPLNQPQRRFRLEEHDAGRAAAVSVIGHRDTVS